MLQVDVSVMNGFTVCAAGKITLPEVPVFFGIVFDLVGNFIAGRHPTLNRDIVFWRQLHDGHGHRAVKCLAHQEMDFVFGDELFRDRNADGRFGLPVSVDDFHFQFLFVVFDINAAGIIGFFHQEIRSFFNGGAGPGGGSA